MQEAYQVGSADRILQKTPFSFDVSVWEFLLAAVVGSAAGGGAAGGDQDAGVSGGGDGAGGDHAVHFVPSMLQVFLEYGGARERCGSLKRVVCSGEALADALREFQKQLPGWSCTTCTGRRRRRWM